MEALPLTAQVKIGDNPTVTTPSALLELEKTDKGLLIPHMTTAQRGAIGSPNEDGSSTGVNPVANNSAAGAGAVYVIEQN